MLLDLAGDQTTDREHVQSCRQRDVGDGKSTECAVGFYSPYAVYAKAPTSGPDLEALDRAFEAYPLLIALIVLFIVGMTLGTIVLFVGLRRTRRVPVWSVVAAVVFVVSGSISGVGPGVLGVVAAVAAFVPAARSLTAADPDLGHEPTVEVGVDVRVGQA